MFLLFWIMIFFSKSVGSHSYGDMPAHGILWRECEKSSDNVAARLAVIPMVQVPYTFNLLANSFLYFVLCD